MSHEPCTGEGKRALHPDAPTRTGVCPDCGAIRAVELPDEGNWVMDFHTILVIDCGGDDDPRDPGANRMSTRTAEREEFLADIITTAVEGGTGYWAQVSQYQYVMDGELHVYTGPKIEGGGTRTTLHEINDDETDYKAEGMVVTTDTIAAAIGKIERGEIEVGHLLRQRILQANRENDAANLDADDADVIVQVALLGEIRYG